MANQRNAAVEDKIRNAEKIVQSYAYGNELDQAINYLKKHDPENGVLATIKDFEDNRPMLKVLNALYRADQARADNNKAELENIAEFLNSYTQYSDREEIKSEAAKILSELPEVKEDPELSDAVAAMDDETERLKHIQEKQNYVRDNTPSMSDDEIVANGEKICNIMDEQFKWSDVIGDNDNITVTDGEGAALNADVANNIKEVHRKWIEVDAIRAHMDDAEFAAMDDKEKVDTLKEDIYTRFWSDVEDMAAQTAELNGTDEEEARNKARRHQPIDIRYEVFDASKEVMRDKVNEKIGFFAKSKQKAAKWLSGKLEKLNNFARKISGYTPAEFGKAMISVFSKRRFAANIATSVGTLGLSGLGAASAAATIAGGAGLAAAAPAIAVAALGVATYSAYSALAQQRWSIWEKKHAYWKAAKEKGDAQEIARWSGMTGWNNALKAIKANPEENKVYEYTKKTNKRYGLASGVLMGAATALVPGSSVIGRIVGGTTRAVGTNQNAGFLYNLAKKKYAEEQTEQNETNMKRARTGLILGLVGTTAMEFAMALNASASDVGVDHNPEHFASLDNENAQETSQPQIEVPSVEPTPEVPTEWNSSMGITQNQWDLLHKIGDFDSKWLNMHNAQHAYPDTFVHADGSQMSIEEGVWMSDRVMALAKAYPDGHGGLIAHMYDENHVEVFVKDGGWVYKDGTPVTSTDIAPECWGTEKEVATFRALYKAINCGEKVNGIDSETFRNLYDKTLHLGPGNNYMDVDNCGKVHFIGFVKKIVNKIVPPVEEPEQEDPIIYEGVEKPEPVVDGHADDGTRIISKGQPYKTGSNDGWMNRDKQSTDYAVPTGPKKVMPGSAVEAGAEKTSSAATGNGDQAMNAAFLKNMKGNSMV